MESPTDRASGGRKRRPNFSPDPESAADEMSISLHEWLALPATSTREGSDLVQKEKSVLRKSNISYGIVELLKAARTSALGSTPKELQSSCVVENFTIFIRGDFLEDEDIGAIAGVSCGTPPSRVKIITPNFGSNIFEQGTSSGKDGFLEVEVHPPPSSCLEVAEDCATSPDETRLRHLLGRLLHSIFLDGSPYVKDDDQDDVGPPESRLLAQGLPSSIHLLCQDLLKGELSIDEASADLHYMILEPSAFLHCSDTTPPNFSLIRSKLHGRDTEIRTMNDTFCKLTTTGVSEVMFVSGFSGSGKSRLVRTVVPHVAVAGGFAISKKFPQGTDDSLSLVLEAINDLIVLVSEDSTDEELFSITSELISTVGEVFLSVIHQVLPSIGLLFRANVISLASLGRGMPVQTSGLTNESITFILKTLLNAISSRDRPGEKLCCPPQLLAS